MFYENFKDLVVGGRLMGRKWNGAGVGRLLGANAQELGLIQVLHMPQSAAAICQGGAPKRYHFTDLNEDAVLIVDRGARVLMVLCDAHGGAHSAELALEFTLARHSELVASGSSWEDTFLDVLVEINAALMDLNASRHTRSSTTFVIASLDLESRIARCICVGDSHLFVVDDATAREVAVAPGAGDVFLGEREETAISLELKSTRVTVDLTGIQAIVLASDGISKDGIGFSDPASAVFDCAREFVTKGGPGARSACLACGIAWAAQEVQRRQSSGDNIAVAAVVLS